MPTNASKESTPLRLFDLRRNARFLIDRPQYHEPVVDGVRALAVLWVIVLHLLFFHHGTFTDEVSAVFTGTWTSWISRGDLGVDLFFVISGFLIGSILFGEFHKSRRIRFRRFYTRRFLRLIPVYTVAMIIGVYFLHNVPKKAILLDFAEWGNAQNMWANLLYVNNFLSIHDQYMGWCWSLAIEEQFYLLLPGFIVLFMGAGRGRVRLLLVLLAMSGVIRWLIIHANGFVPPYTDTPDAQSWAFRFSTIYDNLYTRYAGLLAGVIGAFLVTFRKEKVIRFFSRTRLVNALSVVSLVLMVHVAVTSLRSDIFTRIPADVGQIWHAINRDVFSICAMFVVLAAIYSPGIMGGGLKRVLAWRGFYPIAQLSYSAYLVHEMFMLWLFPRTAPMFVETLGVVGAIAAGSVIATVMTFGGAFILYVLVERPSMGMRSHPWVNQIAERSPGTHLSQTGSGDQLTDETAG